MRSPRIWIKAKPLPYIIGRTRIMVSVTHDGLTFWKKGKQEKVHIPWEKVMPWRGIYDGDIDNNTVEYSPGIGMKCDDRCAGDTR